MNPKAKERKRKEQAAYQRKRRAEKKEQAEREAELLRQSRIEATKQKAARGNRLNALLCSKAFQDKVKELTGMSWDEFTNEHPVKESDLPDFLRMIKDAIPMKRMYGKYFNAKTPLICFVVGRNFGLNVAYYGADKLFEEYVDCVGIRLNDWGSLSGGERRRVIFKLASPSWRDKDKIARVYEERDRVTASTGKPHHVDHVIPLQGEKVCGLHVHQNLAVIDAVENLVKTNRFEVE